MKGVKGAITFAACHPNKPVAGKGLCKNCYYRNYWKTNNTKRLLRNRKACLADLKKKYNLTIKDVRELVAKQNGVCPICENGLPIVRVRQRGKNGKVLIAIDHDKITGKIRGVLHGKCNSHLVASNTIKTAENVLKYLRDNA